MVHKKAVIAKDTPKLEAKYLNHWINFESPISQKTLVTFCKDLRHLWYPSSLNGPPVHCPTSTWPDYSAPYTPYSPPQPNSYYEPHQDPSHASTLHLPTVLSEVSSHEYINPPINSSPVFGSTKSLISGSTELDPMVCSSSRYPDNNTYYPNNWSSNPTYSNNYNYYNTTNNNQQSYLNPTTPTMVLYPHLYSTVNQNQIHVHLHGNGEKLEYINSDLQSLMPSRGAMDIGVAPESHDAQNSAPPMTAPPGHTQIEEEVRVQGQADPASVWRPY